MLIRHGKTEGNRLGRYIGCRTDEPLSGEGIEELKAFRYEQPERVFTSPMKRCLETAGILFPGMEPFIIEDLRECDFGDFENKNYLELSGNADYQAWIDSNATLPFPGGESREEFRERSLRGIREVLEICRREGIRTAAVVTHGGTIMNLMEAFSDEKRDFYGWHVENGAGYLVEMQSPEPEERWTVRRTLQPGGPAGES